MLSSAICGGLALGSGTRRIDVFAVALRAHQPFAPIGYGGVVAVSSGHPGEVVLDLVLAFSAPNDQRLRSRAAGFPVGTYEPCAEPQPAAALGLCFNLAAAR